MTDIRISGDGGKTYGQDLVDRWKARAFAQDPGSETPCCGYEEEDNNWGGSSILLGERVGPVRAIRETWGADSGTNVIRRETFYRQEVTQRTYLRVHVIPALDGIYAQWDFNAGAVDRFYNSQQPAGVPSTVATTRSSATSTTRATATTTATTPGRSTRATAACIGRFSSASSRTTSARTRATRRSPTPTRRSDGR